MLGLVYYQLENPADFLKKFIKNFIKKFHKLFVFNRLSTGCGNCGKPGDKIFCKFDASFLKKIK